MNDTIIVIDEDNILFIRKPIEKIVTISVEIGPMAAIPMHFEPPKHINCRCDINYGGYCD